MHGREPVLGCRGDEFGPRDARLDSRDPSLGIDVERRIRSVLTRIVSCSDPSGAALWPVPCAATRWPYARANRIAFATSWADSGNATAEGCWSTARFHACRAWS
jgi:hypothetical protein